MMEAWATQQALESVRGKRSFGIFNSNVLESLE